MATRTAVLSMLIAISTAASFTPAAEPGIPDAEPRTASDGVAVTERSVELEGVTIRVRELGSGAAVVFLTGGPGFAGEQLMSTAAALAPAHLAIVPDQRGTGASAVKSYDPSAFTIERAVADLDAIRDKLGVERWALVGHSWGSLLSMAYAAEHPGRVRAMALVSPAGIDSSFWQPYQTNLLSRLGEDAEAELRAMRIDAQSPEAMSEYLRAVNRIVASASIANPDENPETLAALRAEMTPEGMNAMVNMAMRPSLMRYDLRPALAEFDAPTLIIQGDQDPIGRPVAERIAETIDGASIRTIRDCGHWPMHEQPAALNNALAEFLKTTDDDC